MVSYIISQQFSILSRTIALSATSLAVDVGTLLEINVAAIFHPILQSQLSPTFFNMDFFNKIKEHIEDKVDEVKAKVDNDFGGDNQYDKPSTRPEDSGPTEQGAGGLETAVNTDHRYASFAPQSSGSAKWYVDGASYFWAVSIALERKCHLHASFPAVTDGLNRGSGEHLHPGLVVEPGALLTPPTVSQPAIPP